MVKKPLCTIVGVGPGVSLSVAKRFAREGFAIAMIARKPESLQNYQTSLRQQGFEAQGFAADAGNFSALTQAFEEAHQQFGHTQVLIYNAAAVRPCVPSGLSLEALVQEFRVNVAGGLAAVQQVLPRMKERKKGTIIFTGGGLALEPHPQYSSLALGKSGIRSLCFSLAGELRPAGIHVATVTICGFVKAGTPYDPDLIAEAYWKLHQQPPGDFEREIIFK